FQAEDGIRDGHVTGVQTCALPIFPCTVGTLHSLLKKSYLAEDLILVDESSMIDAEIMAQLLGAIKKGGRLILVGDPNQLPPVERSEEHTSELQSRGHLVCRLLLEK